MVLSFSGPKHGHILWNNACRQGAKNGGIGAVGLCGVSN